MVENENHGKWTNILNNYTIPTVRKLDRFLMKNLPLYIKDHRIATSSELGEFEDKFESSDSDIQDLEKWQEETEKKIMELESELNEIEKERGG